MEKINLDIKAEYFNTFKQWAGGLLQKIQSKEKMPVIMYNDKKKKRKLPVTQDANPEHEHRCLLPT